MKNDKSLSKMIEAFSGACFRSRSDPKFYTRIDNPYIPAGIVIKIGSTEEKIVIYLIS
jgi:hypothetical protein